MEALVVDLDLGSGRSSTEQTRTRSSYFHLAFAL